MPLEATGVATPWRTSAVAVLLLSIATTGSRGLELSGCGSALGMESRDIKDSAITSSSAYDAGSVGPQHGRLRNDKQGGAWCPRQMVSRDAREWLEVSLEEMHVITGSRTQGRFGNGQGQEYAEEFMLEYWRPGFVKWVRWKNRQGKELLPGNTNTYTIVDQKFDPPVIASKIRFLPYSDHVRTVCMRVEVFGCKWKDGLVSYSVPQGVQRGPELDLTDRTYDGRLEGGQLIGGLGQLVDGQRGLDNFRLDIAGLGKGYEWVGWKNDTPGWAGHPLELLFEFDKVRNFSAVHLHASNYFSKDVQVFSHARVFFSFNGNTFNGEAVQFSYMPDLVLEHARNVTIKLHQRTGRFLKIQLYFASRWLLLSEVAFDSVPLHGNYTDATEPPTVPPLAEKEYSVQRDEVQNPVVEKPPNRTVQVLVERERPPEEPRGQFGPVIGVLTVVIFILVGAIGVIMYRNKWIKGEEELEEVKGRYGNGDQTTIEDEGECDKAVLYAESCRTAHFTNSTITSRSDDKEVRDVISRDYTATLKKEPLLSYSGVSPPVLNFLQKPPPVPPPPEGYFRDVITPLPLVSTPVSPLSGSLTRASVNSHFVLPLSPEPDLPSDPEDEKTVVEDFPRDRLRVVEKLGSVQYGDVHLCEGGECGLVVVHTLRLQSCREEFVREVKALSRIKHANVARLLGACLDSDPVCAVREYAPMGDLCQFLQDHVAETATPLVPTASTLSYGCLIYMATQISSGMEYLESSRYVHKDLAARNCLVGRRYEIKISDLGSYRELYSSDYCQVAGTRPLPVRWMAWESVLLGKYTSKSDVWSFAVLLWEVLTFAREQPFEELNDDKVVENVTHFYQDTGRHVLLNCPINCPKEIYDLMCECWQRNESDRPTFREIHLFLQRKNLGYNPELH